mmetsp:Transcript_68489/g.107760  ORF Transcript_68489/g.107760 Transcript_68489/m.107760 type:complete len:83 (-) Transcript_68489:567-815(-)
MTLDGEGRKSPSTCARRVGVPILGQRRGELPMPHLRMDFEFENSMAGMEWVLGHGEGLSSAQVRRFGVLASTSRPLVLLGLR